MESTSEKGIKFGFGQKPTETKQSEDSNVETTKPETSAEKATEKQPTSVGSDSDVNKTYEDSDRDKEYTHRSSVTVKLVKNYSLYRRANDKVLPKRNDCIGSSIIAARTLASNKEEINAYFPNLIGLAPNNPDFITRVKQYLNNIRVIVDELGKTFDTSFHYYKKSDYYRFNREMEKIENDYKLVNKNDISAIREGLKVKVSRINALESTKHRYGFPINLEDYLMYRHCLLYSDIAKDMSIINASPNIRFYFKDDEIEKNKLKLHRDEINKAKLNYVKCIADKELFDSIYIQYLVLSNLPVLSYIAESDVEKEIKLDKFATEQPNKFNKIFNDKNVKLIGTIEKLIARGELVRSQYNQNISTQDGTFVGANIGEAVDWFNDISNKAQVDIYINKLKHA